MPRHLPPEPVLSIETGQERLRIWIDQDDPATGREPSFEMDQRLHRVSKMLEYMDQGNEIEGTQPLVDPVRTSHMYRKSGPGFRNGSCLLIPLQTLGHPTHGCKPRKESSRTTSHIQCKSRRAPPWQHLVHDLVSECPLSQPSEPAKESAHSSGLAPTDLRSTGVHNHPADRLPKSSQWPRRGTPFRRFERNSSMVPRGIQEPQV